MQVYDGVLRWWVLCALEQRCIAPITELYCQFTERQDQYAKCHRFDQSALNILLANHFNSSGNLYTTQLARPTLLRVARASKNKVRLFVCERLEDPSKQQHFIITRKLSYKYFTP